jgi:hypothetical protein
MKLSSFMFSFNLLKLGYRCTLGEFSLPLPLVPRGKPFLFWNLAPTSRRPAQGPQGILPRPPALIQPFNLPNP